MDMNDDFVGSSVYPGYPLGLGPLLNSEEQDTQGYNGMTEAEKEQLIFRCKDAKNAGDMERIVDSVTSDMDARALMEETSINTSHRPL